MEMGGMEVGEGLEAAMVVKVDCDMVGDRVAEAQIVIASRSRPAVVLVL